MGGGGYRFDGCFVFEEVGGEDLEGGGKDGGDGLSGIGVQVTDLVHGDCLIYFGTRVLDILGGENCCFARSGFARMGGVDYLKSSEVCKMLKRCLNYKY